MSTLRPGDYGFKRKRNIELDGWMKKVQEKREENVTGINWGNEQAIELEEGEEIVAIETHEVVITDETPLEEVTIGERKLNLDKFSVKEQHVETEKLTIYLSKNLIATLKLLKKNKAISSYSKLVSEALEQYLT